MKKFVIATVAAATVASTLMAAVPGACFGCHGPKGDKNTMAAALVPAHLKKAEIVTALEGYKAGTLNKAGKGAIMHGFAKGLSDAQIKDIAGSWGK